MTKLMSEVEIEQADWQLLLDLSLQLQAADKAASEMVKKFTEHHQEIQRHQQDVWRQLGAKYNLDLNAVNYVPSSKSPKLIAISINPNSIPSGS